MYLARISGSGTLLVKLACSPCTDRSFYRKKSLVERYREDHESEASTDLTRIYNLLLTQWLLIQNHFQTLVHIPAHFAKAVFLVEPLGRDLENGGVEMQGLIA